MPQTIQGKQIDGSYAPVAIGNDGSLLLGSQGTASIYSVPYDYVGATYPTATTEVYTTKLGGASGSIQEVVTVTYTDSTKTAITSVARA